MQQIKILKSDWQEIIEYLCLGTVHLLTGKIGQYLHIRPKAANSHVKTTILNQHGDRELIVPKGFYLRSTFTESLIAHQFFKDEHLSPS